MPFGGTLARTARESEPFKRPARYAKEQGRKTCRNTRIVARFATEPEKTVTLRRLAPPATEKAALVIGHAYLVVTFISTDITLQ